MSKIAILGLGQRGEFWLQTALQSGWQVSGFDPDPKALGTTRRGEWRREKTISGTVKDANWIVCCLPERLELMQKVIQRAQAEAPETSVIAVDTSFPVDDVQTCATRRGQLVQVRFDLKDGFELAVTSKNAAPIKDAATTTLAEFAATLSLEPTNVQSEHAESA
ncbi:MAG: NAD(P)-binding domain-containing protein [Paracoccaceae bacterium]